MFYGPSTGATIQLHFERKLRREKPLLNTALTEDERWFDGGYALYVSCAWRLEREDKILCASGDAFSRPEKLAQGLELLVDRPLLSAEAASPGWDVTLTFRDDYHLRVFCDQREGDDNYHLTTPTVVFTVEAESRLASERRGDQD